MDLWVQCQSFVIYQERPLILTIGIPIFIIILKNPTKYKKFITKRFPLFHGDTLSMGVHFKENKKKYLSPLKTLFQNCMPHCETNLNIQMKVTIISI